MTHEFHLNRLHMARRPAAADAFAYAGYLASIVSLSLSMISGLVLASDLAGAGSASVLGAALSLSSAPAIDARPSDGIAILFDIPAQPLQNALDAFGAATGFSGLYSVAATAGRSSAPVRGRYAPDVALRMLLANTGLAVRYTAVDAFILEPGASDPSMAAAAAAAGAANAYYGALQSRVRDAFCGDGRLARGDYRVAMSFRVDAQGQVERPALLSSTGNAARDRAVLETLHEIRLERGPADPSQPFTMLILPGATACSHE